jgi:hypothetical protein
MEGELFCSGEAIGRDLGIALREKAREVCRS